MTVIAVIGVCTLNSLEGTRGVHEILLLRKLRLCFFIPNVYSDVSTWKEVSFIGFTSQGCVHSSSAAYVIALFIDW